jgi:hypothetical protein
MRNTTSGPGDGKNRSAGSQSRLPAQLFSLLHFCFLHILELAGEIDFDPQWDY